MIIIITTLIIQKKTFYGKVKVKTIETYARIFLTLNILPIGRVAYIFFLYILDVDMAIIMNAFC